MIRYDISASDLVSLVNNEKADWIEKAEARTEELIAAGKYSKGAPNWSDIKPVFMDVQFGKCVFCERRIGDRQFSRIEHDLEHFRPKSKVSDWPQRNAPVTFDYFLGESSASGYHWLAYDLKNYAASCKVCNSTLKSSAFPIFGDRGGSHETVSELTHSEKQVLCYPIGRTDVDPATLIEFVGTTAKPRGRRANRKRRGEVIIEFFKLNDRDDLHVGRALKIMIIGNWLEKIENGDHVTKHQELVNDALADSQDHALCSRDFVNTWFNDKDLAREMAGEAENLAFNRRDLVEFA